MGDSTGQFSFDDFGPNPNPNPSFTVKSLSGISCFHCASGPRNQPVLDQISSLGVPIASSPLAVCKSVIGSNLVAIFARLRAPKGPMNIDSLAPLRSALAKAPAPSVGKAVAASNAP